MRPYLATVIIYVLRLQSCKLGLIILFLALPSYYFTQIYKPYDSLIVDGSSNFQVDDYGNIYSQNRTGSSLAKFDSLGKKQSEIMLVFPYQLTTVQNPYNLTLFSENAQRVLFLDQHLNTIFQVDLRQKFGYIKRIFVENPQSLWLMDESSKSMINYRLRTDEILKSFNLKLNFEDLIDFYVYQDKIYWLTDHSLEVYNFQWELLSKHAISSPVRLKRENDAMIITTKNSIFRLENSVIEVLFSHKDSEIVDKNSVTFFEMTGNKLYLYRIGSSKDNF